MLAPTSKSSFVKAYQRRWVYRLHLNTTSRLLAPLLQILVVLFPPSVSLLRHSDLVGNKILTHHKRKCTSKLFLLSEGRTAWRCLAWLKVERVLAIEDASKSATPLKFGR